MDFSKFLSALPSSQLSTLYDSPWTCQAVLRSLPALPQQLVLRHLHVDEPVPDAWLRGAVSSEFAARGSEAVEHLCRLQVLQQFAGSSGKCWRLEPTFQARLRQSVSSPVSIGQGAALRQSRPKATPAQVNEYGQSQWQAMLLILVEGRSQKLQAHKTLAALNVRALFQSAGLLDDRAELTDAGFKFLFMDVYSQLWLLLQQYLNMSSSFSGPQLSEALSFLLQLAFRKATQPLSMSALPPAQKTVAAHMAALGILKPEQQAGEMLMCPTFLAAMLCGTSSAVASSSSDLSGFIVVETSFRVYAYTCSPVQIAILQLFTRTDSLLPNLFAGTLTSKSVTEALQRGIDARMIVRYLEEHRHAKVAHRLAVIPEAVRDQVLLWERELNRLSCQAAVLYEAFDSKELYEGTLQKAQELDVVLFSDSKLQRLVVKAGAHSHMRNHIQATKLAGSQPAG